MTPLENTMAIARTILDVLLGLGVPSALVWFVRDRAKSKAAARVATGTAGAEISKAETSALEAHMAFVETTFNAERQSMNRQVKDLNTEVARLRGDLQARDRRIQELTAQVEQLTTQMEALHDRLTTQEGL